jgi:hypothetical protein
MPATTSSVSVKSIHAGAHLDYVAWAIRSESSTISILLHSLLLQSAVGWSSISVQETISLGRRRSRKGRPSAAEKRASMSIEAEREVRASASMRDRHQSPREACYNERASMRQLFHPLSSTPFSAQPRDWEAP